MFEVSTGIAGCMCPDNTLQPPGSRSDKSFRDSPTTRSMGHILLWTHENDFNPSNCSSSHRQRVRQVVSGNPAYHAGECVGRIPANRYPGPTAQRVHLCDDQSPGAVSGWRVRLQDRDSHSGAAIRPVTDIGRFTRMKDSRTISVLIVEDSVLIRERLRAMLSATNGVQVVGEAAGVCDALQLFATCQPDAVVLDLQLPDGSGIDVLRRIKRHAPQCTVIVLTSHNGEEWRTACLDLGADHFMEKARDFERLGETLANLQRS